MEKQNEKPSQTLGWNIKGSYVLALQGIAVSWGTEIQTESMENSIRCGTDKSLSIKINLMDV